MMANEITVLAPAKVNLTLEVLAERPDGYHEIRSVAQTIGLCDRLSFSVGEGVRFVCADPGWKAEKSLVSGAVNLLTEATGCRQGAAITVEKHIPLISGLSGDSSDGAAVLTALNRLWGLGLSMPRLVELASQLGSDVAFFLYQGTALLQGRGEVVTPLPPLPRMSAVVLLPPVARQPGKTGRIYAGLPASGYTGGEISDRFVTMLTDGCSEDELAGGVFNALGDAAMKGYDGLREYRQRFQEAGAERVHLAGSGPALFTLTRDRAAAEEIYENLRRQGLECYLADTLNPVDKEKKP